jgi:REP element-mobilizing transposase RayT
MSHRGSRLLAIGGMPDHVHLLVSMSKKESAVKLMEVVKKDSSKWIKTQGPSFADFYWQEGYGAFSIGQSGVAALKAYIANQGEHHRRMSFQEEFLNLLKKYQVVYDERYIWS